MSAINTRRISWLAGERIRSEAAKRGGRRRPNCEALEGRQLLNGTPVASVATPPAPHAEVAGMAEMHATPPQTLSAAATADLKALEADSNTLQAEIKAKIPAALTNALKNDSAAIHKALNLNAPGWSGPRREGRGFTPGDDPSIDVAHSHHAPPGVMAPGANIPWSGAVLPADVAAKLEAGGVSKALVTQFTADAKALQAAIQAIDPALLARIGTERQAFEKDAPHPPMPAGMITATGLRPGTPMHFDHIVATNTPSTVKVG